MDDDEVKFLVLASNDKIQEGYSLTTLAHAKENIESVKKACSLPANFPNYDYVRLKNGFLKFEDRNNFLVNSGYQEGISFKLVNNSKSGKEVPKEDCLAALAYAAEHDDVEVVDELVKCAGLEILKTRMPFADGGTILHVCTDWGSLNTLEKVLTVYPHKSFDLFIVDRDGDTALHNLPNYWRVSKSYDDCKRAACLLLDIVPGVNANDLLGVQNNDGQTALGKALDYMQQHVCAALLDAAKTKEEKEGQTAAAESATTTSHWLTLIQAPAAADDDDDHEYDDVYRSRALHLAVLRRYGNIVTKILAHPGAKGLNLTSLPDGNNNTPLHIAAKVGDSEICLMLLKYGVEINKDGGGVRSQNKAGKTPLHIASRRGHEGVCEKLLEYGASLSVKDKHGRYALTNAFARRHNQVVQRLLDACVSTAGVPALPAENEHTRISAKAKGSQLNVINEHFEFGLTPLHVAVAISSKHHVLSLIKAGALVGSKSDNDKTPLHVAAQQNDSDVLHMLLNASLEWDYTNRSSWINMRDIEGQTALHCIVVRLSSWSNKDEGKRSCKDTITDEKSSRIIEEEINLRGEKKMTEMETTDEETTEESEETTEEKSRRITLINCNLRTDSSITLINCNLRTDSEVEIEDENTKEENEETTDEKTRDLKEGAWVDVQDRTGEKSSRITEEEINLRGEKKMTEVETAKKLCDMVSQLLEAGAWVDVQDRTGETPLHTAARSHYELLDKLLSEATRTKVTHNFRRSGKNNMVDKWICMCDFSGKTALHEAARVGHLPSVSRLLEITNCKNPDELLRVRDMENMTALDWAAQNGRNETTELLIDKMMNTPGIHDITKGFLMWNLKDHVHPHDFANYCEKYEVKESQTSLLQAAIKNGDVDIARELVNEGADVTVLDDDAHGWLAQNLGKAASDQPTSEDTLGRRELVQGVATLLLNPYTESPLAIGIFGSWGAGKSSFMLQVEEAMLYMAVKETFRTTPYSPSLGKGSSMIKFSRRGLCLRRMVVNTFKKYKQNADGDAQYDGDLIENFPMELQSSYRQLFKSLALTDRSKLVQSTLGARHKRKVVQNAHLIAYTPAVLTLHYNAWQYDNRNQASAGLAVEISRQLESFMTPHQWLRMCWKYSWKSHPGKIFTHLIMPTFLAMVVVCAILLLWNFLPIATRYKALSLPMGIVGVMGAFLKACLQAIQPVTQTMLNFTNLVDHQSMLGYQHQVIDDIKFLKDQLCEDAHFGWIVLSFLYQLVISNSYFMEGTWIWRQHPRSNNFRIVVFIDDLDRCDEKTILELLRSINLILGSCGISVVIGVDKDMLQRAIIREFLKDSSDNILDLWLDNKVSLEEKYPQILDHIDGKATSEEKDTEKMERSKQIAKNDKYLYTHEFADSYLQKIIQLPIQMPDPSKKHIEQFLEGQVGQRFTRPKKKRVDESEKIIKEHKQKEIIKEEAVKDKQVEDVGDSQSQKSIEVVVDAEQTKEEVDSEHQDGTKDGKSEPIVFRLLLANYTPLEKDMLKQLCQFATKERRIPREWKRFLNYHRLAWTILSQDPNMKSEVFKGWQRKLILWIFICWNWRPQMDVIFKNWHDIISKSSKWQRLQDKENNDAISLELCDIISTYMENMKWNAKEDINNKIGKQGDKVDLKAWSDLHKTLKDEYDIPMHFIEKFQQFRFYCALNHLEIVENLTPKKKTTLNSSTSFRSSLNLSR